MTTPPVAAIAPQLPEIEEEDLPLQDSIPVQPDVDQDEGQPPQPSLAAANAADAYQRLSRFGQSILRVCGAIDDALAGKRRFVLMASIALAGISLILEKALGQAGAVVSTLFGNLLLLVVWFLVFSFAGSLRDDDGLWRGRLVFTRLLAGWRAFQEEVVSLAEAPLHIRWRTFALLFGGLSCSTFAVGNLMTLAYRSVGASPPDEATTVASLGWFGVLLSLGCAALWKKTRPTARRLSELDSLEALTVTSQLPAVLSLGTGAPLPTGSSFVHEVVTVLSKWQPRMWPSETDYQLALLRHFERQMPDVSIQREKRLGESKGDGIADFILGESVILELKRGFRRKAAIDRAVGQMYAYAAHCPHMPCLLVIFEANEADVLEAPATARLIDLHRRQATMTVRMPVPRKYEGHL